MADFNCTEMMLGKKLIQVFHKTGDRTATNLCMRSGQGQTVDTRFKFFRLYVTGTSGDTTIQFTKLQFYSDAGKVFSYWDGTEEKSTIKNYVSGTINKGTIGANGGEAPVYGLLPNSNEGKCCIVSASPSVDSPFIITYELLTKKLDVSVYNNWHWYTANDTSGNIGRNLTLFKLEVSNTGNDNDWTMVDQNTDPSNIKTTANWSLAYEHKLRDLK